MSVASRLGAVALAAVLVAASAPAARPALAVEEPVIAAHDPGRAAPDPVTFVPGARADDIQRRPEAMIGFASRDLLAPRRALVDPATRARSHAIDEAQNPASTPTPRPTEGVPPALETTSVGGDGQDPLAHELPTGGIQIQAEGAPVVSGIIRGPTNAPLAGASVCLDDADGYPMCLFVDQTDEAGAYVIPAAPGTYHIRAFDPPLTYMPQYWSASGSTYLQQEADSVTVATSDVTGRDVTLGDWPLIKGTVTNEEGEPIPGLSVHSTSASGLTAADGTYEIRSWPQSSTTILIQSSESYRGGYYSTAGVTMEQSLATTVVVGSTDVTGIDLVLMRFPTVSGHVIDANGDPVPGAIVQFFRHGSLAQKSATTDVDGAYAMPIPLSGGWTGHAAQGGFRDSSRATVEIADDDLVVDFVLHVSPLIRGQLLDPDGAPISGITVRVTGETDYMSRTVQTDETGSFTLSYSASVPTTVEIAYLDPLGTYVNGVLGPSGFTSDFQAASDIPIDLDSVVDASATIPEYVRLLGTARLASGAVISGGWVEARPLSGWSDSVAAIGTDGTYTLRIAPGSYTLAVPGGYYGQEGFAYESGAVTPVVIGNHDRVLDMVMPVGRSIKGRVVRNGVGVAGIEVDIFREGYAFTSGVTGPDGTYSIAVPPGAYLVGFYDPKGIYAHGWFGPSGYTSDPSAAKLVGVGGAVDATGVDISLLATKRVSGRVVDVNYATSPVDYAFVEAFVNGVYYSSQFAKADGTYNLPVAPGKVTLWMYDPDLGYGPGWRTSTGLSANPASAAVTTVTTGNVTGVTIRAPESVLLDLSLTWKSCPTCTTSANASAEAFAYGTTASFSVATDAGRDLMPLLRGTYKLWIDAVDGPNHLADGWSSGTTLTADQGAAQSRSITASTTLAITIPVGGEISIGANDVHGRGIPALDVQVFANGSFYRDAITTPGGGISMTVLPGTYRIAFVDLYGRYRTGWLGASGFVTDAAAARNVVVAANAWPGFTSVAVPMQSPPAAPTNVAATPYHESALVAFTPTPGTITRPIVHHMVTATPGGRQCVTTGSSCTVTGLTNGTAYTFRVTASSIVGTSVPSAPSPAVTPKAVPNAPGSVTAAPSGSTVAVSWSVPSGNGSAITGYLATISPGGQTCAPSLATGTSCTLSAVVDGRYSVAVTASNALGTGPARSGLVTVDTVAPVVTAPVTSLRAGVSMSGTSVPVTVAWTATDPLAGVADTTLERAVGAGAYVDIALPTSTAVTLPTTLPSSTTPVRYRDRARDANGNWSMNATGPLTYVTLRQETGTGIVYAGSWATTSTTSALGGKLRYTSSKNASVSYTFTGRGVSFVTRKGTTSGKAAVYLDGVLVTTLDLYSGSTTVRWVAYAKTNSTSAKHVLKIVNLATSGRPRLYVDGFATIR